MALFSTLHQWFLTRESVLLQGHLGDVAWKVSERWTREHLARKAGEAVVDVEVRHKASVQGCAFGRTTEKISMSFSQALEYLWPCVDGESAVAAADVAGGWDAQRRRAGLSTYFLYFWFSTAAPVVSFVIKRLLEEEEQALAQKEQERATQPYT